MWLFSLLLVAIVQQASTLELRRIERQVAAKCDSQSSCIELRDCPELLQLLKNPNSQSINRLRELTCVFNPRNPQVCCPNPSPASTSPTVTVPTDPPNVQVELPRSCGHSSVQEKVVGGEDVALGEFPWMVAIGYIENGEVKYRCGGSLINERYVVTASHCLRSKYNGFKDVHSVRLGEHDLRTERDCESFPNLGQLCSEPVVDVGVEESIPHPDFDKRFNISDDIALLRLERNVQFTPWIQPICLPELNFNLEAKVAGSNNVIVAGWGNNELRRQSPVLQKVDIPFVEKSLCQNRYADYKLGKEQKCFGGELGKDSCGGDSGGPLIHPRTNNSPPFELIGIVSFGSLRCGAPGVPAVYTNVADYRSWILTTIRP